MSADEDMDVRPEKVDRLVPITAAEMSRFGLTESANLAYRYDGAGAKATIVVDRAKSRASARSFAFFQILPEVLKAHYVIIYSIEDAKTRRLALLLPDSTPESVSIRGLDGVNVKEFSSEPAGAMRRWKVLLDEARRGEVRLEVDFEMRADKKDLALPLPVADAAVYQSGMVAIEGDLELGVDVKTAARRADVGQLAVAKYTPASLETKQTPLRLLGTYEFVGDPRVADNGKPLGVTVDVSRNPAYALPPAIVQRARLATLLSADGTSQTQATFLLRTKVPYLEVELPEKATLWSAVLDNTPLKPQKRAGFRLIGLPPTVPGAVRSLQLVYEAPIEDVTNGGKLHLAAPRLAYRSSGAAKDPTPIPLVNIDWTVTLPDGYEAVATDGTLEARPIARPIAAPLAVARMLYNWGGGVHESSLGMALAEKRAAKVKNILRQDNLISQLEPRDGEGETRSKTVDAMDESKSMDGRPSDHGIGTTYAEILAGVEKTASLMEKPQSSLVQDNGERAADKAEKSKQDAASGSLIYLLKPDAQPPTSPSAPPAPAASAPINPSVMADMAPREAPPAPSAPAPPLPPAPKPEPAKPADASQPSGGWGTSYTVVKPSYRKQDLSGFRSLKIDVQQAGTPQGQLVTFSSLGAAPEIDLTLARRNRVDALTWGLAIAMFLLGMALTNRPLRQKAALVLGLALVSAVLPLAWDTLSMVQLCNGVFYAACLLAPYYLVAGLARLIVERLRTPVGSASSLTAASVTAAIFLAVLISISATAQAQPEPQPAAVEPPVVVPDDALIVPYDAKSKSGIENADHVLVSRDRYIALWNAAHPDVRQPFQADNRPGQAGKADVPLPYALSDASYTRRA